MQNSINRYQEIMDQLDREGKRQTIDPVEYDRIRKDVNKQLEADRREYQRKAKESQISAQKVVLNA